MIHPADSSNLPNLHTVFLDRDGVVNEKLPEGRYVTNWDEFHLLPGVPEAICQLNQAGLRVIVITNQRGIALGLYTADDVRSIHSALDHELAAHGAHMDAYYICPHEKQQCNCRKPKPGLFDQAKADFPEIEPSTSIIIGDSASDVEFGQNLGMRTVFIQGDPNRQKPGADKAREQADFCFHSLAEAVSFLLRK